MTVGDVLGVMAVPIVFSLLVFAIALLAYLANMIVSSIDLPTRLYATIWKRRLLRTPPCSSCEHFRPDVGDGCASPRALDRHERLHIKRKSAVYAGDVRGTRQCDYLAKRDEGI